MLTSQFKFTKRTEREKKNEQKSKKNNSSKNEDKSNDIIISEEMSDWLQFSLNEVNEDGLLTESVGSILTAPMDSESLYCPTSSLVKSQFSSTRGPSNYNHKTNELSIVETTNSFDQSNTLNSSISQYGNTNNNTSSTNNSNKFTSTIKSFGTQLAKSFGVTKTPQPETINNAVSRLNVLWLQRRAKLEQEEGKFDEAMKTLDEVINLHIGNKDYNKARLGDLSGSNDPTELLRSLEQNYLVYDLVAHKAARKIQVFYDRHYRYLCRSQLTVARLYRGYKARNNLYKMFNRRVQCIMLIQNCFRIHLIKMNQLATKIKMWYIKEKAMYSYKQMLFIFRSARKIQRLFRGNKGRLLGNIRRFEFISRARLQRNTRGYIVRRDRSLAVAMYQKAHYFAAVKIQCLIRRILAIKRCQLQLLYELNREDNRIQRERHILDQTIQIEIDRLRLYLRTEVGKLHVSTVAKQIKMKDKAYKKIKKTLDKKDILAHEAMLSFELFDSDGSGLIDENELAGIMKMLCVPMTKKQVKELADTIDADGSGDIDFGEFLDWFSQWNDAKGAKPGGSKADIIFKQVLRAKYLAMEISGQILWKRAERQVLRECTGWKSRSISSTFRLTCPPKFQCCRCLQPFVLFTDYYIHFDEKGYCKVLNEPALYYNKFWASPDWRYQRQCENEIIRLNDETKQINYQSTIAMYSELVIQQNSEVHALLNKYITSAQRIFLEKVTPPEQDEKDEDGNVIVKKEVKKEVNKDKDVSNTNDAEKKKKEKPKKEKDEKKDDKKDKDKKDKKDDKKDKDKKDKKDETKTKKKKTKKLKEDGEEKIDELDIETDDQVIGGLISDIVDLCNTDDTIHPIIANVIANCLNLKVPEKWIIDDSWLLTDFKHWLLSRVNRCSKVCKNDWTTFTKWAKLKQDATLLANIYIRYLRLSQIELESQLVSLVNFRARRDRKCNIDDEELHNIGLDIISEENYNKKKIDCLNKLDKINIEMTKILVIQVPGCCGSGKQGMRYVKVGADGTLTQDALKSLLIYDAHVCAKAKYKSRLKSDIGRSQVRRLECEQWAEDQLLQKKYKALNGKKNGKIIADLHYIFNRFVCGGSGTLLDLVDMELLARLLSLKIPEDKEEDVKLEINTDRNNIGFATFSELYNWIGILKLHKDYKSVLLMIWNFFKNLALNISGNLYYNHAKEVMHMNSRTITRLELETRMLSLQAAKFDRNNLTDGTTEESLARERERIILEMQTKQLQDIANKTHNIAINIKDKGETDADTIKKVVYELVNKVVDDEKDADDNDIVKKFVELLPVKAVKPPLPVISNTKQDLAKIENKLEILEKRLSSIKEYDDKGELLLIYRMAEDDAEIQYRKQLLTRLGRYNLLTERYIIRSVDDMIKAYGYCIPTSSSFHKTLSFKKFYKYMKNICKSKPKIPESNVLNDEEVENVDDYNKDKDNDDDDDDDEEDEDKLCWDMALEVLIYSFDTDCSGTFDEGEVRLLLDCSKCKLSEKKILLNFPEVKLDSSTLALVVKYLSKRIKWNRSKTNVFGFKNEISISKKSDKAASSMMLISLNRQIARQRAIEAITLSRTGKLLEDDDEKEDNCLIMRCQFFAMRQVDMFLKTVQAKLKCKGVIRTLKQIWNENIILNKQDGKYKEDHDQISMITYAYHVHKEYGGLLITEVPHLIRFLVVFLNLTTNDNIRQIASLLNEVRTKDALYWLSLEDTVELILPMFKKFKTGFFYYYYRRNNLKKNFKRDAKLSMYSRARQQAVLISMQFEDIYVSETNYRCSCLGMSAVIEREKLLKKKWFKKPKEPIDWINIPMESTILLLISKGYCHSDFYFEGMSNIVELNHQDGNINNELMDKLIILDTASKINSDNLNILQLAYRCIRGLYKSDREYRNVVRSLSLFSDDINSIGANFLREILNGTSHCVPSE